jgi:hypothetical protein
VGWIVGLFDDSDDVIAVHTPTLTLAAHNKEYYDWASLTDDQGLVDPIKFDGRGGRYRVIVGWKVFA